jgi:peptide/nickel transport system substrate-binding protein
MGSMTRRHFLRVAAVTAAASATSARARPARAADLKPGGILKLLQTEPAIGYNPVLEGGNWPETQRLVYNGLTDYNATSELIPGLARSWTVSDEGDVFTFRLTPGILFHDGKELTSEDVRFTYEMVVDAKAGSPMSSYLQNLKAVETPDKQTVVLRFTGANLLMMPLMSPLGIVPKHLWGSAAADPRKSPLMTAPVGTGPFKLKEWQRSDHLTFEANRGYFRKGRPYVDQVIFKVVPDAATGVQAFRNGELDAVISQGMPGGLPYALVRQLMDAKPANLVFNEFVQNFNQNLYVNCAAAPFDNAKVRRALAHAINKELIVKALLQGFGRVQDSVLGNLPGLKWAHDPTIKSEYSPAKANQLLDEAGFPRKGGTRFAVTILATEGFRVKLSEALKAMLAPIGIEASIKSYTWPTYIARIRQDRDTAGCLWSVFISRQADPSLTLDYFSGRNVKPGGANWAQWNHPQATDLIEAARTTIAQEKRKTMYLEIQKIVHEEAAVVPLYSSVGVDMWHRSVEGLHSIEGLTGTLTSVEGVWLNR